ncbi:MAG: methyltransferase domain-containing protein [Anaerolineales bacterium]
MGTVILWALGILLAFILLFEIGLKITARIAHARGQTAACPPSFSWYFTSDFRKRYMQPAVERVGIKPGDRVLELGPGPGAFSVNAARRAGPEGRLIAIDIQAAMIAKAEARLLAANITNAETRVAGAYELPLTDSSIDRAFLVGVLGEIADQNRALAELHRVLRPGGVLSITEEFSDPDYPFAGETIQKAEAAGFRLRARFGNFLVYTLNFEKIEGLWPGTLELLACPDCRAKLTLKTVSSPKTKTGAKGYFLHCEYCRKDFPIRDGIVLFLEPKSLTGLNRRFAAMYDWMSWFYRPLSPILFLFIGMNERRARKEILDRLEPRGGRVLEISIGPGVNLPYLRERKDVGEIHGLDISLGQLERCRSYMLAKGWPVELYLGNGETLPYRDCSFESVFHIGGINFFNDKRKAIEEMIRVAKPGARILIADETEKGVRAYDKAAPGFSRSVGADKRKVNAPVDLIPPEMREIKVSEVWNGFMYLVEFQKPLT